jgi:hypothetical protein
MNPPAGVRGDAGVVAPEIVAGAGGERNVAHVHTFEESELAAEDVREVLAARPVEGVLVDVRAVGNRLTTPGRGGRTLHPAADENPPPNG